MFANLNIIFVNIFFQLKNREMSVVTQQKLPLRLRIFEKFPYVMHNFYIFRYFQLTVILHSVIRFRSAFFLQKSSADDQIDKSRVGFRGAQSARELLPAVRRAGLRPGGGRRAQRARLLGSARAPLAARIWPRRRAPRRPVREARALGCRRGRSRRAIATRAGPLGRPVETGPGPLDEYRSLECKREPPSDGRRRRTGVLEPRARRGRLGADAAASPSAAARAETHRHQEERAQPHPQVHILSRPILSCRLVSSRSRFVLSCCHSKRAFLVSNSAESFDSGLPTAHV